MHMNRKVVESLAQTREAQHVIPMGVGKDHRLDFQIMTRDMCCKCITVEPRIHDPYLPAVDQRWQFVRYGPRRNVCTSTAYSLFE